MDASAFDITAHDISTAVEFLPSPSMVVFVGRCA